MKINEETLSLLKRATEALEILASNKDFEIIITKENGYIWNPENLKLIPVNKMNYIDLKLLKGIDDTKKLLLKNTEQFAKGFPANNVLLWGARGMGKSSLVKSIHKELLNINNKNRLILIEVHREDIKTLPILISKLSKIKHNFILYCDDLSFDDNETNYKSLKSILDGGIAEKPSNIIFYATSNRRHLISRSMKENEESTSIMPHETVDEKVSLSDRFGLWLGFYQCSQDDYLDMVEDYIKTYKINTDMENAKKFALEWSITRGARSGRVAWQFIQDLAGKLEKKI